MNESYMDDRAARANAHSYSSLSRDNYICGAPHIRHDHLRRLYDELVQTAFESAALHSPTPQILDLGAGEGSVTARYLSRGANVTAIDVTEARLQQLRQQCADLGGKLETICSDVFKATALLEKQAKRYDLIVATAFLHHLPRYEELLRNVCVLLNEHGQILTFEDPLRFDSLGWSARIFSGTAHLCWRLQQGDVAAGALRFIRRKCGYYRPTPADEVEYHAVRNGVDQNAIANLLSEFGMECRVVRYFSNPTRFWATLGARLGVENSFGAVASRASACGQAAGN